MKIINAIVGVISYGHAVMKILIGMHVLCAMTGSGNADRIRRIFHHDFI
jgi:hypothetical protein